MLLKLHKQTGEAFLVDTNQIISAFLNGRTTVVVVPGMSHVIRETLDDILEQQLAVLGAPLLDVRPTEEKKHAA